jgi:hypothetical protein
MEVGKPRRTRSPSDRPNIKPIAETKESRYRQSMRERGFRLVSLWLPDTRNPAFRAELRRQSRIVARTESANIRAFLDAAAAEIEGWTV